MFAGALDWPGWCRSARDEDGAIAALADYGSRYSQVLRGTRLRFRDGRPFQIQERLQGDATTDFGAPSVAPTADARPLTRADLDRAVRILRACWRAFDRAAERARGVRLATGPRGGGRKLDAIVNHVVGAEASYARMIGAPRPSTDAYAVGLADVMRETVIDALERAATEGAPQSGPRGGRRWTARYFVRRAAWHVLDHAWEIEDRS